MTGPKDLELSEMLDRIKKKELSSTDIVKSCLEAVGLHEAVLNAFISLDREKVLEQSRRIDAAGRPGSEQFLFGVPVAAKDLMERVDAWIWPTTPAPAPRIGGSTDANTAMFTGPVNVIGFPSLALPSGLTGDRFPVSVQIIAEPFAEYRLFKIARVLEEKFNFTKELPDWVNHHQA